MLYFKKSVFFVLLSVFSIVPAVSAQDVVLIANSDVSVDAIAASDVKNIFLGKKSDWGNGSKITFFTTAQVETQKVFLKSYVGKSINQYKRFWKKQVFTGKGKMPRSSANDQEMVNLVTSTGGTIGYIAAGTDLGNAKILSIK
jgi:hypothetical protein